MRKTLPWQEKSQAGRRSVSPEERTEINSQHASEREAFDTPVLHHFMEREDVVVLKTPSGWHHAFIRKPWGHIHEVGLLLAEVIERAMQAESSPPVRLPESQEHLFAPHTPMRRGRSPVPK